MLEGRLLRVRHWQARHENNRSRELKRTDWLPFSNELSADSYVELVTHEDGSAHLGVWIAILMVASKAKPRGELVRDERRPHDAASLARVTRLPESLIASAIDRLLKIGLLEVVDDYTPGISRDPAAKSQDGAAEGKGTEHHHQEGKGTEKEGKRTEADGREGANGFSAAGSDGAAKKTASHRPDDESNPSAISYASPEEELKAIYLAQAHEPITIELLTVIRADLEATRVTFGEYLTEIRKHAGNEWRNPAGFLRSMSKRFRSKTRLASDPITTAEEQEKNYKCPICFSAVRGEGVHLVDGKVEVCECATPEYAAQFHARASLKEQTPQ